MKLSEIDEQGGVGRITPQNQTVDVGPDEVKKQAAKWGFKVDRDGRPPKLHASGKLTEAGLDLTNLRKHGGSYFDELIRKINTGSPINIEPEFQKKYGKSVIIDKSEIGRLSNAFYPNGDKSKANLDPEGKVNVVDASQLRGSIATQDGNKIPFGALSKTSVYATAKGNKGDQGEACLGAAVTAKFLRQGGQVSIADLLKILSNMEVGVSGNVMTAEITSNIKYKTGKNDTIHFTLMMNKRSFDPLMEAVQAGESMAGDMLNLMKSAVLFVNRTAQGVSDAAGMVKADPNNNRIEVRSDGVSDNKGTKADLHLTVDGQVINLISIKVKAQQFGQSSGSSFPAVQNFFMSMLGLDISPYQIKFKPEKTTVDKSDNAKLVFSIYDKVIMPAVKKTLQSGDAAEIALLSQLAKGVRQHATHNSDVDIVHLDYIRPGYKLLRVSPQLIKVMRKLRLRPELSSSATQRQLSFIIEPDDAEAKKIMKTGKLLLKIRSSFKPSELYLRNTIEMGSGLVDLIKVEQAQE